MELEVNSNHKKAHISENIGDKFKRRLAAAALGSIIVVSLFSGCSSNNVKEDIQPTTVSTVSDVSSESSEIDEMIAETIVDKNGVVEISDGYLDFVASACGKSNGDKITVGDLEKIENLTLLVNDSEESLDWLNYCTNVKSMMLFLNTDSDDMLKNVKKMDHLESLSLVANGTVNFNVDNFPFVKSSNNLSCVDLDGVNCEPGLLESITNLKKLTLNIDDKCEIDFGKLTFLEELNFGDSLPYDVAIDFDSNDYNVLTSSGVKITANDLGTIDRICEVNDRLDNIVKGLNLSDESTDKEKLDAILIYTLDNLTYDKEVSDALSNNNISTGLADDFYKDGYLYGALEKDSAICGNYSALVDALSNRVGLNTYILNSNNHAWNLVSVEGNNYYVDATWLDGNIQTNKVVDEKYDEQGRLISQSISYNSVTAQDMIKEGNVGSLDWYMEDPTKVDDIDKNGSHDAVDVPSYIEIKPITESSAKVEPTTGITDITDDEYEVKSGNNHWVIAGGALVGVLAAVGGAVGVGIHRKREKERYRKMQQCNSSYSSSDPYSSSSSFGRRY